MTATAYRAGAFPDRRITGWEEVAAGGLHYVP